MYQALYRKYRPQTFDEVIGQKHITDSLKKQVETGHLSHAYIFIGTRGTGKTTCARILAKAVNCEHTINGNPCCKCDSCLGIADGSIMDIVELDAASNNGVDNVRALREEAVFSPANVKKRVYIIDEVHMLSTAAFNALLKILEEPPEHLIFILATTELQKVPATILSRCQRHSFKRIDNSDLTDYLLDISAKEGLTLSHDAASLIAGLAEGSVRDALSMLDQCSTYDNIDVEHVYEAVGLAGNKRTLNLLNSILEKNTEEALEELDSLWRDGKDVAGIIKELLSLLRDVLIFSLAPKNASKIIYGGYGIESIKELSSKYSSDVLLSVLNELQSASDNMKDKLDPKIVAELCIANLCTDYNQSRLASNMAIIDRNSVGSASKTIKSEDEKHFEATVPPRIENSISEINVNITEKNDAIELTKHDKTSSQVTETVSNHFCGSKDWDAIRDALKPVLPFDMKTSISSVEGNINENFLDLNIYSEFIFNRFNKPDIIAQIEETAKQITGGFLKVRLFLGEKKEENMKPRNLEDLKQFEEINWR